MVLRNCIFLIGIALVACDEKKDHYDTDRAEMISGEKFYQQNCIPCHGAKGDAEIGGAINLITSNLKEEEITQVIVEGRNGMMPFGNRLPSEETQSELVKYVKSLQE